PPVHFHKICQKSKKSAGNHPAAASKSIANRVNPCGEDYLASNPPQWVYPPPARLHWRHGDMLTNGQLLEHFLSRRDNAALEALIGPAWTYLTPRATFSRSGCPSRKTVGKTVFRRKGTMTLDDYMLSVFCLVDDQLMALQ